jgi:hypothetical protein
MQATGLGNETAIQEAAAVKPESGAQIGDTSSSLPSPANDAATAIHTRSYPFGAPTAWIYQPARSATQSGRANARHWISALRATRTESAGSFDGMVRERRHAATRGAQVSCKRGRHRLCPPARPPSPGRRSAPLHPAHTQLCRQFSGARAALGRDAVLPHLVRNRRPPLFPIEALDRKKIVSYVIWRSPMESAKFYCSAT